MSEPAGVEFNVGVDVEAVERFASAGRSRDVLFAESERVGPDGGEPSAARLAGTWCAKEAAVKALWPWVRLDPRRILVERDPDGRPTVSVQGWDTAAADVRLRVSISHSDTVATAVVVVWGPPPVTASRAYEGEARP